MIEAHIDDVQTDEGEPGGNIHLTLMPGGETVRIEVEGEEVNDDEDEEDEDDEEEETPNFVKLTLYINIEKLAAAVRALQAGGRMIRNTEAYYSAAAE